MSPSRRITFESVVSCPACVAKERENQGEYNRKYYWRGMLFAIPASLAGCLLTWGADDLSKRDWSHSFLFYRSLLNHFGPRYREYQILAALACTPIIVAYLIANAARAGAEKRGSRPLQVSAVVLTYLAFSMAVVPETFYQTPRSGINGHFVASTLAKAPLSPFHAHTMSFFLAVRSIALCVALIVAWTVTNTVIQVRGPYDIDDSVSEDRLFKAMGG